LNILVADDDENDRILLVRAFKQLGWRAPVVVGDGEEVIRYLQESQQAGSPLPDVLLLDYWMPRVTGIDVLRWLRAEPSFQTVPVVVLSAPLAQAQANTLRELHAAYVEKAIDSTGTGEAIHAAVLEALSLTGQTRLRRQLHADRM
jgi:CheY-like chemotaxis protein